MHCLVVTNGLYVDHQTSFLRVGALCYDIKEALRIGEYGERDTQRSNSFSRSVLAQLVKSKASAKAYVSAPSTDRATLRLLYLV